MAYSEPVPTPELHTERLILRAWREDDLEPFAAMSADPRVSEYLPSPLNRLECFQMMERMRSHFTKHGFGLWAVEVRGDAPFIGFVGLQVPGFEAAFTPCVEVGWRLAHDHWGRGYASEAAKAALGFGLETLKLAEILAWTVPANVRSRQVMERLGMRHEPAQDFNHPRLPEGHPLQRHVLYRLGRSG